MTLVIACTLTSSVNLALRSPRVQAPSSSNFFAPSPPGSPSPSAIEQFLGSHPAALAFVQYPKPSFATEIFHSVVAYKFTNDQGVTKFGCYIISPDARTSYVDPAGLALKSPSYIYDELSERIAKGLISFMLHVQVAEDGDVTDDSTMLWLENRPVIDLGKLTIDTDNDIRSSASPQGHRAIRRSSDRIVCYCVSH